MKPTSSVCMILIEKHCLFQLYRRCLCVEYAVQRSYGMDFFLFFSYKNASYTFSFRPQCAMDVGQYIQ